ncbi:thioredoxin family protein [Roseiconus lacunae]|uniref:Thioredoxin family protein n=1 Tax=Roseiconus lacunae TaxID=2605694 RepID=A0ABT7PSR0_9BACT|nr:thioredoxin family protein [Roseiconus lacunae]MDM4019515.1 thioredoxin family protein [Roseiconus lacunae]
MMTLDRELSGDRLSIVHFWATWNNVDKLMDVELHALRPDFYDVVNFLSMDTDDSDAWDFIQSCQVLNLPALGFFKGQSHLDTLIGLGERHVLAQAIRQWIKAAGGEPDDAREPPS